MNIKKTIRRILKEEINDSKMKEKLKTLIDKEGISGALTILRIPFDKLLQLLNLTKNEKYPLFKSMIDEAISVIKYQCETMNDEDNEYISVGACDFIDVLVKLEVVDITNDTTIKVRIEYKLYLGYLDEDTFIYELEEELKKYGKFKIDVEESINVKNRQW